MDLKILKKKLDGYRVASGSIKNVPPELLLELRQNWESFTGSQDEFRSGLGIRTGTLRNLLVESKKLNHVIASSAAIGLVTGEKVDGEAELQVPMAEHMIPVSHTLELAFDHGDKVIRFPDVDTLVEFLRKSA